MSYRYAFFAMQNQRYIDDDEFRRKMISSDFWIKKLRGVSRLQTSIHQELVDMCAYQFQYEIFDHDGISRVAYQFDKMKLYKRKCKFERPNKLYDRRGVRHVGLISPMTVEELCYPRSGLQEVYNQFLGENVWFLPPSLPLTLGKMQYLYQKIVAAEGDDRKWIELMRKVKDHQFLCDNVENRLGENLQNRRLWKLYIDYLKKKADHNKLLQTYSKYCRTFEDDQQVLADYQWLAESNFPYTVPWTNPFPFEKYDPNFFGRFVVHRPPPPIPKLKFNSANSLNQQFSLPAPMIKYMRENSSGDVLQKLYESCKIFYMRFPKINCYRVIVDDQISSTKDLKFLGNSIRAPSSDLLPLSQICIAKKLDVDSCNPEFISRFLPQIYRCTAEHISIRYQELRWKDLHFLIGHGKVKRFQFSIANCSYTPDFSVEDILCCMPSIEMLSLFLIQCTPLTFQRLCEMEFKQKILQLQIGGLNNCNLNATDFAKFITKNCAFDCDVTLSFILPNASAYRFDVLKVVEAAITEYCKDQPSRIKFTLL